MTRLSSTAFAVLAGAMTFSANAAEGTACESLAQLQLADTRITRAEMITPAPKWRVPDSLFTRLAGIPFTVAVPFCRVSAVIEKEINVEVWLPKDWNNRFQGVGNAGLTGALNYPAMAAAVNSQFATASTDTGHAVSRSDMGLASVLRAATYACRHYNRGYCSTSATARPPCSRPTIALYGGVGRSSV